MTDPPKQALVPVRQLADLDRDEIKALAALCSQYEGMDLPLYLEPSAGDETFLFCYYQGGALVGAAMAPLGDPIEVLGMVHPDHRRQGVGRTLLGAVRQEGQRRGVPSLLLVCEEAAPSGVAFARAVGAEYRFSEVRMELDRVAFAQAFTEAVVQRQPPHKTLELRQADMQDVDALVALWTASVDIGHDGAWRATVRWLEQDNQRFYVGWLHGEPIGMLRLHLDPSSVFVNSFRVHPVRRGRGYGRQILRGVIDRLLTEDWEHVMIEVATDNTIALSLYESCGFQRVAEYLYYGLTV
jgi:ribosomal protein S18 acetylase RimI-like enzyme